MKLVILNGYLMSDKEKTHQYLYEQLELPDYYGRNLDALYDCLSEMSADTYIILINGDLMLENLKDYGQSLIEVFEDSAAEGGPLFKYYK
ncbi:MAG: barstar family protein [Erysipelotrichaceae bacterium]|nr:barstar family protein [Erysipelotrichaceae bacterium]MBR2809542.1 barstar family protein [Erysipelotrichaceae bacterium]